MHSAYNVNNHNAVTTTGVVFISPEAYDAITTDNLPTQIGLVQDFFANKLAASNGRPLVDDEDLPPKQRFPKPRLGPTGKISSPRKRPLREQQQAAKKKRKLEEMGKSGGGGTGGGEDADKHSKAVKPIPPLKLEMPARKTNGVDPEKDNGKGGPMMSPESLTAA